MLVGVRFAANTTQLSWTSAVNAMGYQVSLGIATGVCNMLNWQDVGNVLN
jgi:hypothetical protein